MRVFAAILGLVLLLPGLGAQAPEKQRLRTQPWPQEVLDAFARLPLQEGGRIKPLHTYAGFQLLRLNGRRGFETEWEEKLTPVAWMLDCFFFPEQAWHYECVMINDSDVLVNIGLQELAKRKRKRDRYSLAELAPAFEKLGQLGEQLTKKNQKYRTGLDTQIVNLSRTLPQLRYVLGYLDFAREGFATKDIKALAAVFPDTQRVGFLDFMERFEEFRAKMGDADEAAEADALAKLARTMQFTFQFGGYIAFLPPADPQDEVYKSPKSVLQEYWRGTSSPNRDLGLLRRIEGLVEKRSDLDALGAGIVAFQKDVLALAEARGEGGKIGLEVSFYEADWFYRALYLFLGAFVLCTALWFITGFAGAASSGLGYKVTYWLALLLTVGGEVALVSGIVIRCVLRGRPPVTTPYEVVLFCVAVLMLILFFVEYTRRNALPLSLGAAVGALGMAVAAWHEEVEAADTMAPLVAVLDTNFWLSTHVTMVSLGYGAGMLAAVIAHVYIFGKFLNLFGLFQRPKLFADLGRMTYGVLCFGLVFATVGTILGGVWANDSWGRFWGWDPKENGALMLVLVYLAIAHARMGGYVREFGLAICSIIVGITVMWAFWGVNLLAIGLHSYGFDETKAAAWFWYRWVEWSVVAFGVMTWGLHRMVKAKAS